MRKYGLLIGGLVLAVAVVASLVVWRQTRLEDHPALVATLDDMQYEATDTYVFPSWWTDGSTAARLTAGADSLIVDEPSARRERMGEEDLMVDLPAAHGTQPAAVAALPGGAGAPWVAVAFESKEVASDDLTSTEQPSTWTSSERAPDATEVVPLPVDLRSNESDGAVMTADAAVVHIGDTDLAIVTTNQLQATLHVCDLRNCRWTGRPLPNGLTTTSLGSSGDGVVAVTEDDTIWYADDQDLSWAQIGSAPSDMRLAAVQDGDRQVTLVWLDREADTVAIQTIQDGQLENAVDRTPVDGDIDRIQTVVELNGRWYLGGQRPSTSHISLPYPASEAMLWELGDGSWAPVGDTLLRNQPDQTITALFVDSGGDLRAISSSAVSRNTMVWTLTRNET